jgi:hypothetical protein
MALKRATDTVRLMRHEYVMCRRVHMFVVKRMTKVNAKLHVLQILVVVANIQMLTLKTEAGGVPCEQ